jgi:hypothetical protein
MEGLPKVDGGAEGGGGGGGFENDDAGRLPNALTAAIMAAEPAGLEGGGP